MLHNAFKCGSQQRSASRIESAYIRNKPKYNDFATAPKQMPPCYLYGFPCYVWAEHVLSIVSYMKQALN